MKLGPPKCETKAGTKGLGGLPYLSVATNREGRAALRDSAPCQSEFGHVVDGQRGERLVLASAPGQTSPYRVTLVVA